MRSAPMTLGVAITLLMVGCAGTADSTTTTDRSTRSHSRSVAYPAGVVSLSELAQRERTAPKWIDADDPVWAALGVAPPDPDRDATNAESETLDEILQRLASEPLDESGQSIPGVSDEEREAGAYLLDSATQMLQSGDASKAIEALDRAAMLDPSSARIEDARVRALLRLNRRADAVDAALSARLLGSGSPLVHLTLGLDALQAREIARAARHLARSIENHAGDFDPAPLAVAHEAFGRVLFDRGAPLAASESIRLAITDPPQPNSDTLFRSELVRLLGRRQQLWERVGDALAPLDPDAAIDAYARAAELGAGESSVGARRAGLLLRAGRPSEAASEILSAIRASGRPLNQTERTLLRVLGRDDELSASLAAAIIETSEAKTQLGPTARSSLIAEAARMMPADHASVVLSDRLVAHGYAEPLARQLLGRAERSLADRVDDAVRLIREQPTNARRYAAALFSAPSPTPVRIREQVLNVDEGWAQTLLAMSVDLQLRRPRDAFERAESLSDAPGGVDHLARIECASAVGRWDVVTTSIEVFQTDHPEPSPTLVRALRAAHRFEDALRAAEQLPTEDQLDVELLMELAELAIQLQRPRDAELYLEMASELDPFDERILASQLALYGENAPLADPAQHTRVLRNLRQRAPDGEYALLLGAQDLIASGVLDEPEAQLRALAERNPDQRAAFELLHQIWSRQGADPTSDGAIDWLRSRIDAAPGQPVPSAALARLFAARGSVDEALSVIDEAETNAGAPGLAGLRERLLREDGKAVEANTLALERLDHPTLSIDEALERGEIELAFRTQAEAAETLRLGLPEGVALTPAQRARLLRLASISLATIGSTDFNDPALLRISGHVLGIVELAYERVGDLPWTLHNARIMLTAFQPGSSVEQVLRACEDSVRTAPARVVDAYRAAARPLLASDRPSDALSVTISGAIRDDVLADELFTDAISIAAQAGAVDDSRTLIERLDGAGLIGDAAGRLRPEPDTPLDTPAAQRAEVAYQIASIATYFDREGLAEEAYRLSLEYDPAHAWSNNDLGYMLVDRGSDIIEGERLISRAYERLPDSHNVTDSLAWARYKLGQFEDEPDRPGAISLLRRAIELQDAAGQVNATLHDHLGDALWRAGSTEQAIESWLNAESIALDQTRSLRRDGGQAALERVETRLRELRKKLRATQTGEDPPVAPIASEIGAQDPDG